MDAAHPSAVGHFIHPATYLLGGPAQALSYIRHPVLSHHHALWASEAPEGRVGRQVGAAQVAAAAYVRHAVRVLHVEQSALHDLNERTGDDISTSSAETETLGVLTRLTDRERSIEFPALL